jgi:hypothetical protein
VDQKPGKNKEKEKFLQCLPKVPSQVGEFLSKQHLLLLADGPKWAKSCAKTPKKVIFHFFGGKVAS